MTEPASARIAVFPGSFDPPTLGHRDVLERAAPLFDRVVIGVLENPGKRPLLPLAARMELWRGEIQSLGLGGRVEARAFQGLAIEFAAACGARWILRGLRSAADLEDEWPMALSNRAASAGRVETVFIPSRPELSHIRSRLVRELAAGGGEVASMVSPAAEAALRRAAKA